MYNARMAGGSRINWEVLRRSLSRSLRGEWKLTLLGLAGPLAICGWTLARPFDLRAGYHNLTQCAIWLAAWYTVWPLLCALLSWTRPRRREQDADTRHLPLSQAHVFLQRAGEFILPPLYSLLLSLPLWLAVGLYLGIPYGQRWSTANWGWYTSADQDTLWPWRLGLTALVLLGATLLSTALVVLLHETLQATVWRVAFALGLPVAVYFVVRQIEYSHFHMCYRQTRGYDAAAFLLPIALWLALCFALGLVRPLARLGLLALALLLAGALFLWTALPAGTRHDLRPVAGTLHLLDARQALAYLAGHLSPVKNVRLVLAENMGMNNVLLAPRSIPPEPDWQQFTDASGASDWEAYRAASDAWEQAYQALPRLPLWLGAVAYPILLALLSFGGLLLGYARRRDPPREDAC